MTDFLVHFAGHPRRLLAGSHPELVLGRAEGLDFQIKDPTISRRHARLTWREGTAWLEDLGSRHGCFRNGVRIEGPQPVAPGDRIALGRLALTLEAVDAGGGSLDLEATPLSLALGAQRPWQPGGGPPGQFSSWREALDLLHSLSLELLRPQGAEPLLGGLLDQLFSFLGASRGAVLVRDAAGTLAPLAVRGEAAARGPLSLSPATLETTLSRRAAMVFPAPGGEGGRLAETRTRSAMAVPLEHEGQVLGLFYFDSSPERGPFTEQELRFVAALANLAAAKLLAGRVAEELRRQQDLDRDLQAREAAAQAKGDFLAVMSHEIRTPMNIVLGFAQLARKEALPPKAREYLDGIEHSGRSLVRIVNDILDFSKLEAGKLALEAIPFRPDEVVGRVLAGFAAAAADKGLALDFEPLAGPERVGDPFRLGQVLTNLVGNAIKFTERGGVRVGLARGEAGADPARLRFSVRDSGIGIAPERLAQLFSPYAQAEAGTSRQYGGTGLGLAIARQLVERMGGELKAESSAAGSTFAFTLALPPAPAPGPEPEPSPAPDLRGRRLLLVEDHPLNRDLARALLAETGAQVDPAGSGGEALERLAAAEYDAVLMDIHMAGMDGCATTRRIRAAGRKLPVIALTAQDLEAHREAWLAAGLDDFVAKPIEPGRLFAVLGRWVPPAGGDRQVLDALAGFMDVPAALGRAGGRAELLVAFLRGFLEEPIQPGAIAAAVARGDRDAAARMAHDLKGIAGTLALAELGRASAELESCLQRGGAQDWQAAWGRVGEFLAEFLACAGRALGPGYPGAPR